MKVIFCSQNIKLNTPTPMNKNSFLKNVVQMWFFFNK
jgi:hypothetical protein